MKERDRKLKAYDTAERTVKVMYKSLCPACEYNATHGKKISSHNAIFFINLLEPIFHQYLARTYARGVSTHSKA